MKRNNFAFYVLILCLLVYSNTIYMNDEKQFSMAELVNSSKFIIYGRVISINSYQGENGWILSDIRIQVQKNLKGKMKTNMEIVFTIIGGTLGNRTTMTLVYPRFKANQEMILFLNQIRDESNIPNSFFITGMGQGKFDIIKDLNDNLNIIRDESIASQLVIKVGAGNKILSNKLNVPLTDFVSQVQSLIKNGEE